VSISVPLPPASLHAHAKGSWRSKRNATKDCREQACAEALVEMREHLRLIEPPMFNKALLYLEFFYPDLRRRDLLNTSHSCKPYIDGMVDAGLIPDDDWKHMGVGGIQASVHRPDPHVTITLADLSTSRRQVADLSTDRRDEQTTSGLYVTRCAESQFGCAYEMWEGVPQWDEEKEYWAKPEGAVLRKPWVLCSDNWEKFAPPTLHLPTGGGPVPIEVTIRRAK